MGIDMLSEDQLKQLIIEKTEQGDNLSAVQFIIELGKRKDIRKKLNKLQLSRDEMDKCK